MPFAVTQWALNPDPRPVDYITFGWDFGQMSPWKWVVSTTDATGELAVFNDGILCHNDLNSPSFGSFVPDVVIPHDIAIVFTITGTQLPAGGPPTFTIEIQLDVFHLTAFLYQGRLRATYPTAIQIQSPIVMVELDPVFGTIPNPMQITPVKWNA